MSVAADDTSLHRGNHAWYRLSAAARDRCGWAVWVVFAIVVAVSQFRTPPRLGNVFQVYRNAGCHWLEGQPLYDGTGTGFIYLPQCALLCVPLSFMSFYWGGAVVAHFEH